eukprot:TRINITY_DN18238_c0_g1_i1.p1 TRINITY_DN18238_c0_g1~~TRINITY_DN18238_c0_g1_i1.p1  ORF type:complete len:113 (+),score=33.41 TRINITY_DN18238_c0_g1_i1:61-399(+)
MSVQYEVNITMDASIEEKYISALKPHIKDLLALDGFKHAVLTKRNAADEGATETGEKLYTVCYTVENRAALQNYFNGKAAEMRKEMMDLFPPVDGKAVFSCTRRIHEIVDKF